MIVQDPTHYFVFSYPNIIVTFSYFTSKYSDPYLEPNGVRNLDEFCLPYKYSSFPELRDGIEPSEVDIDVDDIIGYNLKWIDMTESDVNTAFLKRALEYYELDSNSLSPVNFYNFLSFHYERYKYKLSSWLDYISCLFDNLDINRIPTLTSLQIKKLVNEWIAQKRLELTELNGEIIRHQSPTVEKVEETIELDTELEKTAHRIVLLHELGIIEHLQKLRNEKFSTLTDAKFAQLIGLILDLKGNKIDAVRKGISGYGLKKKDDPKTPKALNEVKSKLLQLGIEFQNLS